MAQMLEVSVRRVRQLRDRLGAIEVGGSLVFSRAAVEKFKKAPPLKRGWPKGKKRKLG